MDIPAFTRKILDDFDKIRGKNVGDFWDLVVLTASDEEQAKAYEQQINMKKTLKYLPIGVEYIVFPDPPGVSIGCGRSTMYVIEKLHSTYGEELWSKKILLLHGGGQSQRLPSASVLGKIFTALPIGDPMYQLFDLKLACYLPLLKNMKPGIFHAAGDTIEVYDLGTDTNQWTFTRPGFTALAHPSSLEIGQTHGVYVLEETDEDQSTSMRNCLEVLQKPSIERMKNKRAILKSSSGKEFVFTDSCFYFDHDVSQKFLSFYKEHPIECEIDSYGDFLQCLGPMATVDYTKDVRNVRHIDANLVATRIKIYDLLRGTPLNILALEASKFYHFGTMPEYIENFCNNPVIASELGFKENIFSHILPHDQEILDVPQEKRLKLSTNSIEGCVMSSIVRGPQSTISPSSVVEYCHFERSITIGINCIISNCQLLSNGPNTGSISIPAETFMHTVWTEGTDGARYGAVTFILGINDNIKKTVKSADLNQLKWFGKPLPDILQSMQLDVENRFKCQSQCSLWTAKLFPVYESMSESFQASYDLLQCVVGKGEMSAVTGKNLVSIEDVVNKKSVAKMLDYRKVLQANIMSKMQRK